METQQARPDTNPHHWIRALRRSQDWLASLVTPLTPEQLQGPSYHAWSIAEVVGHLGSQAEISEGWLTAALEGTQPGGLEVMQPIWEVWNARAPQEAVTEGLKESERLVRRFEDLSDDDLGRMHLSFFGMELDGAGLARLRLGEHAVHTWDVAVALDPTAQMPSDAVALLIDTLDLLAGRAGKPQRTPFRLHVHTTEPTRDFSLRVGEAVELSDWDGGASDGELTIPAEAFVRLVYGRLDPDHTLDTVNLTGPISLDELRRTFPGF